jgi:hypothetical protein
MLIRLRDIDLGILDGKEPRAKGAGRTLNGRLPARGLALDQQSACVSSSSVPARQL